MDNYNILIDPLPGSNIKDVAKFVAEKHLQQNTRVIGFIFNGAIIRIPHNLRQGRPWAEDIEKDLIAQYEEWCTKPDQKIG